MLELLLAYLFSSSTTATTTVAVEALAIEASAAGTVPLVSIASGIHANLVSIVYLLSGGLIIFTTVLVAGQLTGDYDIQFPTLRQAIGRPARPARPARPTRQLRNQTPQQPIQLPADPEVAQINQTPQQPIQLPAGSEVAQINQTPQQPIQLPVDPEVAQMNQLLQDIQDRRQESEQIDQLLQAIHDSRPGQSTESLQTQNSTNRRNNAQIAPSENRRQTSQASYNRGRGGPRGRGGSRGQNSTGRQNRQPAPEETAAPSHLWGIVAHLNWLTAYNRQSGLTTEEIPIEHAIGNDRSESSNSPS